MVDIDLTDLTVAQAARLIHRGELSPVELTEAYLQRIERLDPKIGAYITVTAERARADARRSAEELVAGLDRGPLHGIPIGLKDLFDSAGVRTTGGTNLWASRVPSHDSAVARKLREAGTVLLGKQNLDEVAAGPSTENPHFGTTHNPWDLTRIAGGSSGGSAAAIAASLALATMGSDTGGSIRFPAALCGVVGLKPTYGRVSLAGAVALAGRPTAPSVAGAELGSDAGRVGAARTPRLPNASITCGSHASSGRSRISSHWRPTSAYSMARGRRTCSSSSGTSGRRCSHAS
jgi:aspartyl-tRNA(Asn)/glutamyl-tRNA(Gln) amidotransferase subunit A